MIINNTYICSYSGSKQQFTCPFAQLDRWCPQAQPQPKDKHGTQDDKEERPNPNTSVAVVLVANNTADSLPAHPRFCWCDTNNIRPTATAAPGPNKHTSEFKDKGNNNDEIQRPIPAEPPSHPKTQV
jgi:hypothetical protein